MVLSNVQQLSVLLWSLLFGVCLGAVYDLLRAFRVFVKCPAIAVLFQDLFYFLAAAIASFLFIFEVNDGTVRLFILIAFLAGGLAERCTAGLLLIRICHRIRNYFLRRPKKERRKRHTKHKMKQRHSSPKAGKTIA
ncbi:MAG: spore cortex biosynthesis protein YabQ [Clostridia bacterium]|nr:spore cortex biosynthesis protein YabQ [Clostridia bacterium]